MIETLKTDWIDASRARVVPVKIFSPRDESGPFPILIFSHGLGSSRDVYGYLGRHWAANGFVSVHLQHAGSDAPVWEKFPVEQRTEVLHRAALVPENSINRPKDVSFAIDELTRLNSQESVFKNRLDLNRIGVAGHSFGAFTALASVGQLYISPDGEEFSFGDSRIKAAIAMSAPTPRDKTRLGKIYSAIQVPCFHMTGTEDDSPFGESRASDRRIPFDQIFDAEQYLVTFENADHFIFSGRWKHQPGGERDAEFQSLIQSSSTAFWNGYLNEDTSALDWLRHDFPKVLNGNGTFEQKQKDRSN
jgi:predicted dienelactone hydrolase